MNINHVEAQYDKMPSSYDTRWQDYLYSTHKMALNLAGISPSDLVLDASSGTGLLAEKITYLMGREGTVTLIDISNGMLELAKKRLSRYQNVQVTRADVHNLPFAPEYFSKVLTVSALHHYRNPNKAISEFYRVLKLDGSLIIVDWCNNSLYFKVYDIFMRIFDKAHNKTHTTKELESILVEEGFNIDEIDQKTHGLWPLMAIKANKKHTAG